MEALYGLETLHMKGEQSGWQRDMYALGVVVAKLQNWTVDPYVGVAQQRGMKGNGEVKHLINWTGKSSSFMSFSVWILGNVTRRSVSLAAGRDLILSYFAASYASCRRQ